MLSVYVAVSRRKMAVSAAEASGRRWKMCGRVYLIGGASAVCCCASGYFSCRYYLSQGNYLMLS